MNTNPKYNPEDLEDLLLHKSFDELHESEQEFVLQHIDSISEYKELRNTLLSIKEYSQNNEQIVAEPKVKEALLELFEKESRKPFAWFSLNSIGAFLFPTETPIFRKPAFQITTFAILALFVVNIGNNLNSTLDTNLAQNEVKSSEESKVLNTLKEISEETESNKIQEEKQENKDIESKKTIKISKPTPVLSNQKERQNFDNKTSVTKSIIGDNSFKNRDLNYKKTKFRNKTTPEIKHLKDRPGYLKPTPEYAGSPNVEEDNSLIEIKNDILEEDVEKISLPNKETPVSLNEITLTPGTATNKMRTVSSSKSDVFSEDVNSQSLENETNLIDILFITM